MADPIPEFYEQDDVTLITNDATNPLSWGSGLDVGSDDLEPTDGDKFPMHLWNDKGAGGGSDEMVNVKLTVKDQNGGNTGQFVLGTVGNGNTPFYKARSFGSFGAVDDLQTSYTPIGGSTFLSIGNIASNQRRDIWVLLDIPPDAVNEAAINRFLLSYDKIP